MVGHVSKDYGWNRVIDRQDPCGILKGLDANLRRRPANSWMACVIQQRTFFRIPTGLPWITDNMFPAELQITWLVVLDFFHVFWSTFCPTVRILRGDENAWAEVARSAAGSQWSSGCWRRFADVWNAFIVRSQMIICYTNLEMLREWVDPSAELFWFVLHLLLQVK